MGLPSITITFKERARDVVIRSMRGVVGLILKESSLPTTNPMVITNEADIPNTLTAANQKQIKLALKGYNKNAKKVVCYFVLPTHTEDIYTEVTNPKKKDNPSSKGWYVISDGTYSGTTDTAPASGASYYAIAAAEPAGSENPASLGWLERSGTEGAYTFAVSEDATVGEKTYYIATAVTPEQGDNPSQKGWYEVSGTTYAPSTDTEVNDSDTYYTKGSQTVQTPDITEALEYFHTSDVNYLAVPTAATDSLTASIVTWVKAIHANDDDNNAIIVVLPNAGTPDTEYVVNYATSSVTDVDGNTYTAEAYCARIAGILATTPLTESCTYIPLPEITDCTAQTKAQIDAAIDAGQLVVFNDGEKIKIARGVNSFTTTTTTKSKVYSKIKTIDTMMLIRADIARTAQDRFIGRFVNTYDNKMILVSAINTYFSTLVTEGALSSGRCWIDAEANRKYLVEVKELDVTVMTDKEILEANTDDQVFLAASIQINDAIEEITLAITI